MLQIKVKALTITAEHLIIGQQMMGKANRLSMLQMGIAWHDGLYMLLCQVQQHLTQIQEFIRNLTELILEIKVHICRHLVITRASRMELTSYWPNLLGQKSLHIHMNIFITHIKLKLSSLITCQQLFQTCLNSSRFLWSNDSCLPQHFDMG